MYLFILLSGILRGVVQEMWSKKKLKYYSDYQ